MRKLKLLSSNLNFYCYHHCHLSYHGHYSITPPHKNSLPNNVKHALLFFIIYSSHAVIIPSSIHPPASRGRSIWLRRASYCCEGRQGRYERVEYVLSKFNWLVHDDALSPDVSPSYSLLIICVSLEGDLLGETGSVFELRRQKKWGESNNGPSDDEIN